MALEISGIAVLTEHDIYLFREGTHARLHEHPGCHPGAGGEGARFAVLAPSARSVSVIGDRNGRGGNADSLQPRAGRPRGGAR